MNLGISQKLAHCIVRPPRTTYDPKDLGRRQFLYKNRHYEREDFTVLNNRGRKLQCSLVKDSFAPLPTQTIVFLHANGSSRLTMKNYLPALLPYYDILSFDFAGCGLSEGKYVTLGYNEKEDVQAVIREARGRYGVKSIILWGRSMGAATALLYTAKYGGVAAIVSDNSFSDLEEVAYELADHHMPIVPGFVLDSLLDSAQQYIDVHVCKSEHSNFNLKKLKPIEVVSKIDCPIFYIGSCDDTFVNVKHTKRLFEKTQSIKRLELVRGDHNELRSEALKEKVIQFLKNPTPVETQKTPDSRVNIFTSRKYSRGKSRSPEKHRKSPIALRSTVSAGLALEEGMNKVSERGKSSVQSKESTQSQVCSSRPRSRRKRIFADREDLSKPKQFPLELSTMETK